jgi:hypothetical protein
MASRSVMEKVRENARRAADLRGSPVASSVRPGHARTGDLSAAGVAADSLTCRIEGIAKFVSLCVGLYVNNGRSDPAFSIVIRIEGRAERLRARSALDGSSGFSAPITLFCRAPSRCHAACWAVGMIAGASLTAFRSARKMLIMTPAGVQVIRI